MTPSCPVNKLSKLIQAISIWLSSLRDVPNERVAGSRIHALYAKGSGVARGQILQVAVRKCMAETYSTSKKKKKKQGLWRVILFDSVLSEIDLGNVDT